MTEGEKTLKLLFMLEHPLRGPGRGPVIAGANVHNQRMEGCISKVLKLYHGLFYHLKTLGFLDPTCNSQYAVAIIKNALILCCII